MSKLNVAVIFGGKSGEHEVSLMSATNVINAMDKEKYNIKMIGITKEGKWLSYKGAVEKIVDGSWQKEAEKSNSAETTDLIFSNILNKGEITDIDVVFPVLHGPNGEDGTIQGMLEMLDLPYVGCGVLASSVAMDKILSKKLFAEAGISIVDFEVLLKKDIKNDLVGSIKKIEEKFKYPVFVKPANMGSSVGISKAHNREELTKALELAGQFDRKIVVEKAVDCREIECAVMGNDEPLASGVGEVIPSHEFYDYEAKYFDGDNSKVVIPAMVDETTVLKIREMAVKAYKSLDCAGLARADFFLDKNTGEIYINEFNTIPGFTRISMYPKLWGQAGVSYSELIDRLIQYAIERYNDRKN